MKTKNVISYLIMVILFSACSHEIEKITENSFVPPTVKTQPRLLYPKDAQERGYTGSVKIIFTVLDNGAVDKASVVKSTGYEMLDVAALDYCKQIIFIPAVRNGKNVSSRIVWDINFNISDVNIEANSYLMEIEHLYRSIKYAITDDEKKQTQKQILRLHNEFVNNMKDAIGFNLVLKRVLLPEVIDEWKNVWDSWPLSFLLYHDFIQRFNDYENIEDVKMKMSNALVFDINYIEKTKSIDSESQKEKELLLGKINDFILKKYPDIQINKNI